MVKLVVPRRSNEVLQCESDDLMSVEGKNTRKQTTRSPRPKKRKDGNPSFTITPAQMFPGLHNMASFLEATGWADRSRTYEQGIRFDYGKPAPSEGS